MTPFADAILTVLIFIFTLKGDVIHSKVEYKFQEHFISHKSLGEKYNQENPPRKITGIIFVRGEHELLFANVPVASVSLDEISQTHPYW